MSAIVRFADNGERRFTTDLERFARQRAVLESDPVHALAPLLALTAETVDAPCIIAGWEMTGDHEATALVWKSARVQVTQHAAGTFRPFCSPVLTSLSVGETQAPIVWTRVANTARAGTIPVLPDTLRQYLTCAIILAAPFT